MLPITLPKHTELGIQFILWVVLDFISIPHQWKMIFSLGPRPPHPTGNLDQFRSSNFTLKILTFETSLSL